MANDPQSLVTDGKCFFCYNLTEAQVMELQLLVNKLQGQTPVCVTPSNPALLATSSQNDTTITFSITPGAVPPTVAYIIKWGTVSGGPYATGSKTIALPGPYTVGTADGLVVGTPYYFVVQASSGASCLSAGNSAEVAATLVVSSGLIIQNDSTDFLGSAPGANVNSWFDHSGNGHSWATGTGTVNITGGPGIQPVTPPTVDKVRTAGGNPTVRFAGSPTPQYLKQVNFFGAAGFTGLEVMCVFKRDNDPPATSSNAGHPFNFTHPLVNFPNHCPFTDGAVYEGFGLTTRGSNGNPATDLSSAFRIYNASSKADGTAYFIKIDNEALFSAGGGAYTYSQEGFEQTTGGPLGQLYTLGIGSDYAGAAYCYQGNIAAVYVWNRVLSAAERANMRAYFHNVYGVAA